MHIGTALVWPALALVFAGAFCGLWVADRTRLHLFSFGVGFFALFLAMTVIIAMPWLQAPIVVSALHGLACVSVMAIVWGTTNRLGHRTPLFGMCVLSGLSCILLYVALDEAEHPVALIVQNETSGLLFGIGAVSLWTARSTNVLDRVLVWTLSLLAGISILRPLLILYLHVEIAPLVEREIELSAINVVILTVLTAVLGLVLVVIAIQEALEIRHGSKRADPVSGFLDQRTFEQVSETELVKAKRLSMPVTLAVLQLDWFEKILEKWGADTSDMIVREIADVVRSWQRDSDVIGRLGEDKIAVLFVGVRATSAQQIVCKLREEIDHACNERTSGLLKFTLSSSIVEARSGQNFKRLLRETLSSLFGAHGLGANVSFVNGVETQSTDLGTPLDGTFVSHG